MVYNSNECMSAIADLFKQIDKTTYDIRRGEEMLNRLACYPADQKLPKEVLSFIKEYSTVCSDISTESIGEVVSTISDIITGLRKALVKLYTILREIFRLLFDSQYRIRKTFIDISRNLMVMASDVNAVEEFESIPCTVITQKEALESIEKSLNLINLIKFVGVASDNSGIDRLLNQFSTIGGINWVDEKMEDACDVITSTRHSSFKEAGWGMEGLQKTISRHIDCLSGVEILKDTEAKLEKEIRELSAQVSSNMYENVSADTIKPLQQRIALRVRIVKVIRGAISILVIRSNAISNILKAINGEAIRITEERKIKR